MKDFGFIPVSDHVALRVSSWSLKDRQTPLYRSFTTDGLIHVYPFAVTQSTAEQFTLEDVTM